MKRILLFIYLLLLCSCSYRAIYIQPGKSVRLAQDIKNVKVWVKTETNETVLATMKTIPEGWYCVYLEE